MLVTYCDTAWILDYRIKNVYIKNKEITFESVVNEILKSFRKFSFEDSWRADKASYVVLSKLSKNNAITSGRHILLYATETYSPTIQTCKRTNLNKLVKQLISL